MQPAFEIRLGPNADDLSLLVYPDGRVEGQIADELRDRGSAFLIINRIPVLLNEAVADASEEMHWDRCGRED